MSHRSFKVSSVVLVLLCLCCLQNALQPACNVSQTLTQKRIAPPSRLVVVEKRGVYGNNYD